MSRCLLIDDDGDSREAYAEYLRGFGYDVEELGDAREAMAAIAMRRPDIVLLDLQMPHLDGFDLLDLIKAVPAPPPVVVISALVRDQDRDRATAARCDAFLPKPALPHEVLATIQALIPPDA
jgi:CheY-like chemotaxis protein